MGFRTIAKLAVVQFPGSNCDRDCVLAVNAILGLTARLVWHQETSLSGFDGVVLPGGFSYGDYLRPGAIARFSPIMQAVREFAEEGKPVLGICNGFQILCEAGLLPGALVRNRGLRFICDRVWLRVENPNTMFTSKFGETRLVQLPIAHGDGCYYADEKTLARLEAEQRVVFRYCNRDGTADTDSNPNGSLNNIAGIVNDRGNVLGLMPHPERAVFENLGLTHGRAIFSSLVDFFLQAKTLCP